MFKMHQLTEKNNKGNATVEMCFIMPIILWICVNVIYIFMDVIGDGVTQGECYLAIYTYVCQLHICVYIYIYIYLVIKYKYLIFSNISSLRKNTP